MGLKEETVRKETRDVSLPLCTGTVTCTALRCATRRCVWLESCRSFMLLTSSRALPNAGACMKTSSNPSGECLSGPLHVQWCKVNGEIDRPKMYML